MFACLSTLMTSAKIKLAWLLCTSYVLYIYAPKYKYLKNILFLAVAGLHSYSTWLLSPPTKLVATPRGHCFCDRQTNRTNTTGWSSVSLSMMSRYEFMNHESPMTDDAGWDLKVCFPSMPRLPLLNHPEGLLKSSSWRTAILKNKHRAQGGGWAPESLIIL